jgi:hypothetical protein
MKLSNVIKGLSDNVLPLGTTPAGQAWCTKCLHPADNATPVAIPDHQAKPHAFLAFSSQYTISPPGTLSSTDSWAGDLLLSPDVIGPAAWYTDKTGNFAEPLVDRLHATSGLLNHGLNSQITGTGSTPEEIYQNKLSTLQLNVREMRPAYFGATVELQAPSLADQGTVTCSQYDLADDFFSFTGIHTVQKNIAAQKLLAMVRLGDMATYGSMMSTPGSYIGQAKEGVYAPLKLSPEALHFTNVRSSVQTHSDWDAYASATASDTLTVTASTGTTGPIGCCRDVCIPLTDGTGTTIRDERLPRLTSRVIHMCFRGLSPSATLVLTIRHGYEATIPPGSIYSPYITMPPMYDQPSIDAYFAIARQLADAYPGDYNSLGALLPIIADIASETLPKVLPALRDLWGHVRGAFSSFKEKKALAEKSAGSKGSK